MELKEVEKDFEFVLEKGASLPVDDRLKESIERTVNQITKHKNVVQLDDYNNYFLVRMFSNSKALKEEESKDIITHVAHVSLKRPDGKKVTFGVWQRLKQSSVLN